MTSDEDVESLSELGLAEAYLRKGNLKESIKHAKIFRNQFRQN